MGQAPTSRPSKALKRPQHVRRHAISGPQQVSWRFFLTLPGSRRHAYAVCGPSQSEQKSEMNTRSGFALSPPRGSPHSRHVDHGDDSEYDAEDDADLPQNFRNADESIAANHRSSSCSRSPLGLGAAYPCTDSILSGRRDHKHGRDHISPYEKPSGIISDPSLDYNIIYGSRRPGILSRAWDTTLGRRLLGFYRGRRGGGCIRPRPGRQQSSERARQQHPGNPETRI